MLLEAPFRKTHLPGQRGDAGAVGGRCPAEQPEPGCGIQPGSPRHAPALRTASPSIPPCIPALPAHPPAHPPSEPPYPAAAAGRGAVSAAGRVGWAELGWAPLGSPRQLLPGARRCRLISGPGRAGPAGGPGRGGQGAPSTPPARAAPPPWQLLPLIRPG